MSAYSIPAAKGHVAKRNILAIVFFFVQFSVVIESFSHTHIGRFSAEGRKPIYCRKSFCRFNSRRLSPRVTLSRLVTENSKLTPDITALADGSGPGYSDTTPYPFFDFESSAEAAYISPAVSPAEMLKIIQAEANSLVDDPILADQLRRHILNHQSLATCLSSILTCKLSSTDLKADVLMDLFTKILESHPKLVTDMVHDLLWIRKVDPATIGYLQPLLFFKGFHAIQVQRMTHVLWLTNNLKKKMTALALQSRVAEIFGVDAHPGARISHSVMLDHASGIVIGETAAIGHSCYMLHGVTLGATGKSGAFDRHPKVRNNVKIGAGAMILGNIALEDGVVVGAGAVVTLPVSKGETVVGVNRLLSASQKQQPQNATSNPESWMYSV